MDLERETAVHIDALPAGNLSDARAYVNGVKNVVGLGILTMPWATARVGMIPSACGLLLIAGVYYAALMLGVKARERFVQEGEASELDPVLKMQDAAERKAAGEAVDSGLGSFELVAGHFLGTWANYFYTFCVLMVQVSIGVAYIAAVAQTVPRALPAMSREMTVLVMVTVCILLSFVRHLKEIAYMSTAALLVYGLVFGFMVVEGTRNRQQSLVNVELFRTADFHDWGAWFACFGFTMNGFPVNMMIHGAMEHRSHSAGVFALAALTAVTMFIIFAFSAYIFWGTDVKEIIYMSFPEGSLSRTVSVVAMATTLVLSFVLQLLPIYGFIEVHCPSLPYAAIVVTTAGGCALVAYALPSVIVVLGTLNNIPGMLCSLIMPGLVFLQASSRYEPGLRMVAVLAILCGVVGTLLGMLGSA
mmetsp:Transcript_30523/g.71264  ORF Transcript_30523/g.71264 Transcript_30523/m.71264 type:complete len:417 (-) Transcript_30523:58-1308(-)|eukprot:CAMPEP_0178415106 /NCGR_PEP_ID=MMETSP0689_2-20121128/23380_1 /TAXON_ID=160604 /ORGANISM="Amphidinium massartii, Strain CS-259" /LENGTH=416 /DNA_ID=CAMNT_0020036415 /DNA_START=154 /DNA_END=1404 /DNA_ORIENTATION=+